MSVLAKLQEQREAAQKELRDIDKALKLKFPVKDEDGNEVTERDMTPEEEKRSNELLAEIKRIDKESAKEFKQAKQEAARAEIREHVNMEVKRQKRDAIRAEIRDHVDTGSPRVEEVKEPMQYGINSDGDSSYWLDFIRYNLGPLGGMDLTVIERMGTWAHQVEREIANDTDFGKRAVNELRGMQGIRTNPISTQARIKEIRERGRASLEAKQEEFRSRAVTEFRTGATTGGGATASAAGGGGAAFVIPIFYESQYAPFREPGRAFADACNQRPLPPYGMTVYVPAVQSAAQMATQAVEGGGIAEQDPSAGFIAGGLITTAGQVTVTQQLLDRAGPNVAYDQIMFDQLRRDYAPKWDTYVLTQTLAVAGTTAGTFTGSWAFIAAPGTANFVSKVAGCINAIETTSGTIMSPTDIFMRPTRWNFIESSGALDSTTRSLVIPTANGPFNAFASQNQSGFVGYEGNTGYKLFGLPISKDLNIPTPGSGADQAIVGNLNEVWAFEGPLVPRVVPQTLAPNLAVLLQLYSYGTAIVRYPNAVQVVSGTGMASITF